MGPEGEENKSVFNTLFTGKSTPSSWKKMQKVDGVSGMPIPQLVEIAYSVYDNKEKLEKKKK